MLIIQISLVEAGNGATNAYGSNLGNQAGFEQQSAFNSNFMGVTGL
jgi:hypothetical protein